MSFTSALKIAPLVGLLALVFQHQLLAKEIDPKAIATATASGKVKFSAKGKMTIWLDDEQSHTIAPVVADNPSHTYRPAAEYEASVKQAAGLPRPPPPPPKPINHGGPRPPLPVPPGPHNSKPPKPPPKPPKKASIEVASTDDLLHRLASDGTIVGMLETEGIRQPNWRLGKGKYTVVLTSAA